MPKMGRPKRFGSPRSPYTMITKTIGGDDAKAQLGVVFDQTPQGRQERPQGLNLMLGRCAFEDLLIDGFKGFQTG